MTGQSLLNIMELLNQELQLQSGEADATRGLLALNVSQDYFESLAAQRKGVLGGQTGSLNTAASTETTAFPSGVLRIDSIWALDSSSRPEYRLKNPKDSGGHRSNIGWPLSLYTSVTPGKPVAYYTNGTNVYWNALPDATYSMRWYGFQVAADITAGGTFAYADIVALPIASFAVKLMKSGLDDSVTDIAQIAFETFKATLDALGNFNRDGASGLEYTQSHTE
jgi:hypothetical protein